MTPTRCAECERLRRAYIDATRENMEIASLLLVARGDHAEARESLKESSLRADIRWRAVKAELDAHLAAHPKHPDRD